MVGMGGRVSVSVSDSVSDVPGKRRDKETGGLIQRHDHPTCPPLDPKTKTRPDHRCKGRWVGSLAVERGAKQKKYVYGRTRSIAEKKLRAALRERDEGTLVIGTDTVASWLATWLERKARTLKPQTIRGYRSQVATYIVPALGRHRLTELRAAQIERLYDAQRADGKAEATIRQTHAILSKALTDARRKGMMRHDPMAGVDPPTTHKNKRAALTLEQAQAALAVAGDDARWWLGLFCGMRQGEVLGLRWQDIDLDRGILAITQTLQTADGDLVFGTPKSDAGSRSWPMPPWVEARVKLHWLAQGRPTEGLLFARPDGSPVRPWADYKSWQALLERAGLPRVALHSARQSAASLMEAAGVADRLAAQILGHSTVQITHGYQSADYDRVRAAWASMGDVLRLEALPSPGRGLGLGQSGDA